MKTFVNFSNHSSSVWGEKQKKAAAAWGELVDVIFPEISADADEYQIGKMADCYAEKILRLNPAAVMCQGEFTLVYAIVRRLQAAGVKVVAACSERKTLEITDLEGEVEKHSFFEFVRFREYK